MSEPSRYTVRGKLGSGTYGDIYECEDNITHKIYVMKKLKGTSRFEHLLREIGTMQKLSNKHPNIVKLVDVTGNASPEMVMEKVPLTLLQFIGCFAELRRVPLPYIRRIVRDLCRVCSFIHSRRIMHRDLKPENILIAIQDNEGNNVFDDTASSKDVAIKLQDMHTADNANKCPIVPVVKVCDFGMCRMVLPDDAAEAHQVRIPTPRATTMSYRAPEMMLGRPDYSPSVDVWSVGCILAEMATFQILIEYTPPPNDQDGLDYGEGQWPNIVNLFTVIGSPTPEQWLAITVQPLTGPISPEFPKFKPRLRQLLRGALPAVLGVDGMDLLERLLAMVPEDRISAAEALQHPFLQGLDD